MLDGGGIAAGGDGGGDLVGGGLGGIEFDDGAAAGEVDVDGLDAGDGTRGAVNMGNATAAVHAGDGKGALLDGSRGHRGIVCDVLRVKRNRPACGAAEKLFKRFG